MLLNDIPCFYRTILRFAVTTVMFTTTALLAFQIRWVKHSPIIFALAFFIFFGFFDGLFWGAALKKVPDGAWVPLMLGMILWVLTNLKCQTLCLTSL